MLNQRKEAIILECNFLSNVSSDPSHNDNFKKCGKTYQNLKLSMQLHILKNHQKQNEIMNEVSNKNKCSKCPRVFTS